MNKSRITFLIELSVMIKPYLLNKNSTLYVFFRHLIKANGQKKRVEGI